MEEPEAHGQIHVRAFGTGTPARCIFARRIFACITYGATGNKCDAHALRTAGHKRQSAAFDKRRNNIARRESNTRRRTDQLLASINSTIIPGRVRQRTFQEALESNISTRYVQNAMHRCDRRARAFRLAAPQRTAALRAPAITRSTSRMAPGFLCVSAHHVVRIFAALQRAVRAFVFPTRISQNALPARPRTLPRCRKRLRLRRVKRLRGAI